MILTHDQWLADADCPELYDAFNGPSDYDESTVSYIEELNGYTCGD
jgi:hypothetical protein